VSPSHGPSVLHVESCSDHSIVGEALLQPGDFVAYGPGVRVDGGSGGELRWAGLVLEALTWREHAQRLLGRELPEIEGEPRVLRLDSRHSQTVLAELRELVALARSRPEVFGSPARRRDLEKHLVTVFVRALSGSRPVETTPRSLRSAVAAVRQAVAVIHAQPTADVAALSRTTKVPRRSLERAFHLVVGTGPAEFARRDALCRARELLLSAGPRESVASVAQASGFAHLGRFAGYYRRAFGESPSQTLKRTRTQGSERH
jgi:AraC-like DNA-binding protein